MLKVFFLFSLAVFSKPNAVIALPLTIFCFLWEFGKKINRVSKPFMIFLAASSLVTISYFLMVRNFYSTINVMVWDIGPGLRTRLHLAALGHHVFDWILPFSQILHPRQTDFWLELNYDYLYLGVIVWVVVLGILFNIHKFPKEMARSFFWIIAFYAPVSGLVFEHLNFYSARYAYPSLIGFVGLIFQIIEYYKSRYLLQKLNYALIPLLIFYYGIHLYHNFDAVHRWQESSLVWKHSYLNQPDDPALSAYFLRSIIIDSGNKKPGTEQLEPYKKSLISFLENKCSSEEYLNRAIHSCSHFRETMFAVSANKENAYHLSNKKFEPCIRCKGLLYQNKFDEVELILKRHEIDISRVRENKAMRDCRYLYLCFAKGLKAAEEYKNKLIRANMARSSSIDYWNSVNHKCVKVENK